MSEAGRRLVLLALCWLCGACGTDAEAPHTPAEGGSPPNILFISVDDLNDWVGVLGGHPQAHTPHMDRLASRGLLFTSAHTPAPACNPARTSILTGLWPHETGIYGNGQPWRSFLPHAVTLPQYFKASGYRSLGSGKIFHGPYPDPRAWHEYHPAMDQQMFGESPVPPRRPLNGIPDTGGFDWGPIANDESEMDDWKTASWVAERLGEASDEPFFLACGFSSTHRPWYIPAAYFEPYPPAEIELPPMLRGDRRDIPRLGRQMAADLRHGQVVRHRQWHAAVRAYLASITFVDRQVGRVLDALDAGPHAENTIVVLWSDHGMHLGEKGRWEKYTLWERSTRVPLIVVAPGITQPGSRSDRAVSLMDLHPTLIDLAGLPERDDIGGLSLRPLLEDPEAPWKRPALTTWGRGNHALRSEHWRYIRYHNGGEELYDHRRDPNEWTNLADHRRHAPIKRELSGWLPRTEAAEAPFETPDPPRPAVWPPQRAQPAGALRPVTVWNRMRAQVSTSASRVAPKYSISRW